MIDWDDLVLNPVMAIFGEGAGGDEASLPTYTPRTGISFKLPAAVFDASYQQLLPTGDGGEVTTSRPVLGVRRALFAADPAQNDTVYIPSVGKTFVVVDQQPDGHGQVLLILMETA